MLAVGNVLAEEAESLGFCPGGRAGTLSSWGAPSPVTAPPRRARIPHLCYHIHFTTSHFLSASAFLAPSFLHFFSYYFLTLLFSSPVFFLLCVF